MTSPFRRLQNRVSPSPAVVRAASHVFTTTIGAAMGTGETEGQRVERLERGERERRRKAYEAKRALKEQELIAREDKRHAKQIQRSGRNSINIQSGGDIVIPRYVRDAVESTELLKIERNKGVPHRHVSFADWVRCSTQIPTPYEFDWAEFAECLTGIDVETWEDVELLGDVIAELWERNGI